MRKAMLMLFAVSTMSLTACGPVISGTVRTKDVPGTVAHQPVTANLNVRSTRVSGRATVNASQEAQGRNAALRAALAAGQADVLVAPTYTFETNGGKLTVTVSGYPATYTDFRNATAADMELLKTAGAEEPATTEGVRPPANANRALWTILGTTVLVVLLSAAAAGGC